MGTWAGERFVMLPHKESGVVECVGCNVDGKLRAREEGLKWVPMVPTEAQTLEVYKRPVCRNYHVATLLAHISYIY